MEQSVMLLKMKEYNKTLSTMTCSKIEKQYIKHVNETKYLYSFPFSYTTNENVETFLKENHNFEGLLKEHSEKLCFFLRNIHKYTCNKNLIRMDARSTNFSYYSLMVHRVISSFYMFYGLGLDLKKAIYGEYRDSSIHIDFSYIISTEIMLGNQDIIGYIEEVLTSENNTAVLTRDVIKAIEQSENEKLHDLLVNLFLAAKLQEGLRQSIIETVDEYNINLFYRIIDTIEQHNLLRFSSLQRGILTWIGIGYETVEDKIIKDIFSCIHDYIHHENHRREALEDMNPLHIYIALYVKGIKDVDQAINEALHLLQNSKRHIVACALIYLKLTNHFDPIKYVDMIDQYQDDEWIKALYASECIRVDFEKTKLKKDQSDKLYDFFYTLTNEIKATQKYSSKGFEWFHIELHKTTLINKLFALIEKAPDQNKVERFLPFVSSLYKTKVELFMDKYFSYVSADMKKDFLLKEIISHNEDLVKCVEKEYLKIKLTKEDIIGLESRLKTKKSYARASIVRIIAKQDKKAAIESYERLTTSSLKSVNEAALELKKIKPDYFDEVKEVKIIGKQDGFSLYKPKTIYPYHYSSKLTLKQKGIFKKQTYVDLSFLQPLNKDEVLSYFHKWNERIKKHALDEYEVRGEYRSVGQRHFFPLRYGERTLDVVPLSEIWRKYLQEDQIKDHELFHIIFLIHSVDINFDSIMNHDIHIFTLDEKDIKAFEYFKHFELILNYYFYENSHKYTDTVIQFLELMNKYTRYKQYKQTDTYNNTVIKSVCALNVFSFIVSLLKFDEMNDEQFIQYFPVLYETYIQFHLNCREDCINKFNIPMLTLSRAVVLKLIPQSVLYEAILDTHTITPERKGYYYRERQHRLFDAYRDAYYKGRGVYGKPDFSLYGNHEALINLRKTLDDIVDTLLPLEASRYNEETEVTNYVSSFTVIRGIRHLIQAVKVLEGENLKRQSNGNDRNTIFTNVIRHCYKNEDDDIELLRQANIEEKRLVEIAMLAPQWIDVIDEILNWDGFKEACYYFIAHMKDYNYDEKKAEIAKYTDIDPSDLNDGAFDMNWCQSIYDTLGDKRFSLIYKSAKFLCDNSFHTRARKYADATLKKVDKDIYLKQVIDTRNKDSLNAYCISPIENDQDLLERYLNVQKFLKESKQFGAQRQASEARCVEIAFMNLARNSRFETPTRLSWMMETETLNQYAHLLQRQSIGDIEACISIDEFGNNEIVVYKNNKQQKSIPAKYKKDETILHLKEVHKILKEQHSRSKKMLEEAMENQTVFTYEEIETIMKNPIVSPMLKKLVLFSNNHFGFYEEGKFKGLKETYDFDNDIRIAHPYDLYHHSLWHLYQEYIFKNKLVQPFKQVFRELYLKLEDELKQSYTKRYSGYQIQIQKTKGALKSRKWNVSYESGLEKICYKDNLVVSLYADADWFSPSDIEAPSIDYVGFTSRKDHKNILVEDIDNILFSEIMRDVDLAVSVAYVGGVDPITSFSTMELRKTIIEYTCKLMKLTNVSFSDHFVNIHGTINDYSIHLGSGNVHQSGGGSIHILPVHSQKRGKVYLPFLDEDPVTATILSKVILLAEDKKLKDPSILEQITSRR